MAEYSLPQVVSQTPLALREMALANGALREQAHGSKIIVRGDSAEKNFVQAVLNPLAAFAPGLELPQTPNTLSASADCSIYWLGPDEWLFRMGPQSETADHDTGALIKQIQQSLAGIHSAVVDVSDYYTVLQLQSEHALDILSRSCPLDLQHALASASQCAQTRIGNAPVLLDCENIGSVRIQVRWSYADYLWQLLERSAISFS